MVPSSHSDGDNILLFKGDVIQIQWKDDLRPMPDKCPPGCEEAAYDMSLVVDRRGAVISSHRNLWGNWILLVACDDGQFREVYAKNAREIK